MSASAPYTVKEAATIVGVSRGVVLRLIAAGWLMPEQGKRGEHRLSFRDLVVLRTAKGLKEAGISPQRISTALRQLRLQLPDTMPLAGLRIVAQGNDVAVLNTASQWEAINGQYLLAFDIPGTGSPVPIALPITENWFDKAFEAEESDLELAIEAYQKAVAEHDCSFEAFVNYGRLLHEGGLHDRAVAVYESGISMCPHAVLYFNFAVLREDMEMLEEALRLYLLALDEDPTMEDAHFNLGLLHERMGRVSEAIRHFNAYRRLVPQPEAAI